MYAGVAMGTLGLFAQRLVESVDPDWKPDPELQKMNPTYSQALAQIMPVIFPEILYRLTKDGKPLFPEFAAAIKPTEFAPGKTFGSGTMKPIDYMEALTNGRVPIPKNLNIRVIQQEADSILRPRERAGQDHFDGDEPFEPVLIPAIDHAHAAAADFA